MRRELQALGLVTQVGLTIAVCIVVSLLLGLWIDNTFGTKPWATLLFALLGIAAGSYSVYRMVSEAIRAAEEGEGDASSKKNSKRRKENE